MKKKKHDDSALSCSLIRRPIQRWGWLFLLPTFAAFCVGFLYPFAKGLFLSFCKFKTTSKWTWVGLKNYQTIFQDEGFLHAFWYTALFALVSLLIINVLAFAVAYVLTKGIKGSNIFRTVFFMPNLIGGIVLGYIWLMIFDGILSNFDTAVVLETKYGFWGLIILMCWQQIGYMMIIYIAGLQNISKDLLEAAAVDGANKWTVITRIKLPLLAPVVVMNVILCLASCFKAFDIPMAMPSGGPAGATTTIALQIYNTGFSSNRTGYATAQSIILFLIISAITAAVYLFQGRKDASNA